MLRESSAVGQAAELSHTAFFAPSPNSPITLIFNLFTGIIHVPKALWLPEVITIMNVDLSTEPRLLRNSFPNVRKRLGGNNFYVTPHPIDHELAKRSTVTIFDGTIRSEIEKDGKIDLSTLRKALSHAKEIESGEQQVFEAAKDQRPWPAATLDQQPESEVVAARQSVSSTVATPVPEEQPEKNQAYAPVSASKPIWKRATGHLLSLIVILSILIAAVIFVPAVYYSVFPADVIEISTPEQGTPLGGGFLEPIVQEEQPYIPPVDENLPDGNWIIIPRIGVNTLLRPTEDPNVALAEGVWQVPNFGVPGDRETPMILAAHRYGWKWWWKDDYWKYHSFYLLPDTQPGDRIEIIADKRKWVYEIYAGEEGEEITDYSANLILYTCKFLKGPIRHFRYAKIIDPTKDSQASQDLTNPAVPSSQGITTGLGELSD